MEKWIVSSSPHLREGRSTQGIMRDVLIALLPAAAAAGILFGPRALLLIALCVASCVAAEWVCRRVMKRENTISDLSAAVTGMLLAFNLPVGLHPLMAVFGCVVAIVVVKQMFGGIGQNFVNPALTARIVLMTSFPSPMSSWVQPFAYLDGSDAVTAASPLGILKESAGAGLPGYLDLFLGARPGCLGETCALALLLGGVYLVARRVIHPAVPLTYLAVAAALSALAGRDVLTELMTGGLLLGAIFMATDYTTTPVTLKGRVIFAAGCGVLTMLIRLFGSLPEGVSFSIILMNLLVPYLEKWTRPRPFGAQKEGRGRAG